MNHFLKGQARDWYSTVCDIIFNWKDFQEAFLKRYCDIESDFILRKKILDRKQRNDESFKDFVDDLMNLFACRESTNIREKQKWILLRIICIPI